MTSLSLSTHGLLPLLLSLCLGAAANPLPAPTPPPLSAEGASASAQASKDCTTYVTSLNYGFTGNWQPTMKETVYTATSVVYTHVPCGGCKLATTAALAAVWGGHGPVVHIEGTVTAASALTSTSTVCLPENGDKPKMAVPGPAKADGAAAADQQPARRQIETTWTPPPLPSTSTTPSTPPPTADRGPDCTTTRLSAVQMTAGPVRTIWTGTVTGTSHVDCGGCRFVAVSTLNGLNPGPRVSFNSTVTATVPSAAVTFACLKSPSIVATPEPGWPSGTNTLPIERTKRDVAARETGA